MGCSSSKKAPTDAVDATAAPPTQHRINKIPIKPGKAADIIAVADSAEFQAKMTWAGFLGVDTYFTADNTMYTHSRWESETYATEAAAALSSVLGGALKEFIAGPPVPTIGPPVWTYAGTAAATPTAVRLTTLPIKPGSLQPILAYMRGQEKAFDEIAGCCSVEALAVSDTCIFVAAKYDTMEALDAAAPAVQTVLGGLKEHFAGKPTAAKAAICWSYDNASEKGVTPTPPLATPPQGILDFYYGEKAADKGGAAAFGALFAEGATVSFLGDFRPKMPDGGEVVIPQPAMEGVAAGLIGGFSDFMFNPEKAPFTLQEDGGWSAVILVAGTHDGPYSPMEGVPPLEATGTKCLMGPERFTLYFNEEGKVTKKTVEPLQEGPSGPPGFYVLAGGKLG